MSAPPKQPKGCPTFPPFEIVGRARTWRCVLFGCIFEWRRVDAWWEREECRWCRGYRNTRLAPEHSCRRCGQQLPTVADPLPFAPPSQPTSHDRLDVTDFGIGCG